MKRDGFLGDIPTGLTLEFQRPVPPPMPPPSRAILTFTIAVDAPDPGWNAGVDFAEKLKKGHERLRGDVQEAVRRSLLEILA